MRVLCNSTCLLNQLKIKESQHLKFQTELNKLARIQKLTERINLSYHLLLFLKLTI